ncbi:helix-turn-helix domain-containing protein [Streptomyces platensis]|uniref:helix-turn-helix domain-containing protein n=1 Tax=Streptomyces platensis TaxID=58346 RepID=UPI0030E36EE3
MGREQQDLRNAIAGLLGDSRFQGACAKRDMGALFRLLNHRGLSTRRIAAAVGITQGRLYDYMNDKSRVEKLAIFEQISDALFIPVRCWDSPGVLGSLRLWSQLTCLPPPQQTGAIWQPLTPFGAPTNRQAVGASMPRWFVT